MLASECGDDRTGYCCGDSIIADSAIFLFFARSVLIAPELVGLVERLYVCCCWVALFVQGRTDEQIKRR